MPSNAFRKRKLSRLAVLNGAVGVIGHRDQTGRRGRGGRGDAIWTALAALGFEGLDYDGGEDLEFGKRRQVGACGA